jgi:hypothetical protein
LNIRYPKLKFKKIEGYLPNKDKQGDGEAVDKVSQGVRIAQADITVRIVSIRRALIADRG